MSRYTGIWLTAALLLAAGSTSADEVSDLDRFELWNDCRPMDFDVIGLSGDSDAKAIGLTEDAVKAVILKRLRAAGLYSKDQNETELSSLLASVNIVNVAFTTIVDYYKVVSDSATGLMYTAPTWSSSVTGVNTKSTPAFILSSVTYKTDEFIDEYLRVNETACK